MKKIRKLCMIIATLFMIVMVLPIQTEAATVKLNKTKATLYIGRSTILRMARCKKKITWSSSKKKVAVVNKNGKVIAKKAGTVTIKAKVGSKIIRCKITVKNPSFSKKRITIEMGQNYVLKLKGTKAKSWSSNNKRVATVKNGKVKAKKAGTATITCKGSNGKAYKCIVIVTERNTQQSTTQSTIQSTVQPTKEPTTQPTAQSTKEPTTQPTAQSTKEPTSQPATQSTQQPTVQPTSQPTEQPTVQPTSQPIEPSIQQGSIYTRMIALKETYPEGMPWTNANYYQWKGGIYSGGYGCAGFAFLLSDAAFDQLPAYIHYDFTKVKVGDILRVNHDGHSVIVLELQSDSVIVAEGNYNSSIHWGRKISSSELQATGTYVISRYPH